MPIYPKKDFIKRPYGERRDGLLINDDIRGMKIMLIDEEGVNLGVFSKFEALQKGQQETKDVIQIGFNEKDGVVIAKFMELGKYKYQIKKEKNEKKKTQKSKGMKELKYGYNIGDNDLELKIKKAEEFLKGGYSVKIVVVLKGRENVFKEKAYERMKILKDKLLNVSKPQQIKFEKNGYSMILFAKVK